METGCRYDLGKHTAAVHCFYKNTSQRSKIYNATSSLKRFVSKNIYFYFT
jgi:hypothetical protein